MAGTFNEVSVCCGNERNYSSQATLAVREETMDNFQRQVFGGIREKKGRAPLKAGTVHEDSVKGGQDSNDGKQSKPSARSETLLHIGSGGLASQPIETDIQSFINKCSRREGAVEDRARSRRGGGCVLLRFETWYMPCSGLRGRY